MRILILLPFLLGLTSCSTRYIKEVPSEAKTKFGFEVTAPNNLITFLNMDSNINYSSACHINQVTMTLWACYNKSVG